MKKLVIIICMILCSISSFAWEHTSKDWGYNGYVNTYYRGETNNFGQTPKEIYTSNSSAFQGMRSTSAYESYCPMDMPIAAYSLNGTAIVDYDNELTVHNVIMRMGIAPPHNAPIGGWGILLIFAGIYCLIKFKTVH